MAHNVGNIPVTDDKDDSTVTPWGEVLSLHGEMLAKILQGRKQVDQIGVKNFKIMQNPKTHRWGHWVRDGATENGDWRLIGELGSEYTDFFATWDAMGGLRYVTSDGSFLSMVRMSPTGSGHSVCMGDYEDFGYLASKNGTYLSWIEGPVNETHIQGSIIKTTVSKEVSFIPEAITTSGLMESFTVKHDGKHETSKLFARLEIIRKKDGKIYYQTMPKDLWDKNLSHDELIANEAMIVDITKGDNNLLVKMPVKLPILYDKGQGDVGIIITVNFREEVAFYQRENQLNRIERWYTNKQDKVAGETWAMNKFLKAVTDNRSIGIGGGALESLTTGEKNIVSGGGAGSKITTGSDNILFGDLYHSCLATV